MGKILNPYVLEGVHSDLDEEAMRTIESMPNWMPVKQNGIPREVGHQLPILFILQDKITQNLFLKIIFFQATILFICESLSNQLLKEFL